MRRRQGRASEKKLTRFNFTSGDLENKDYKIVVAYIGGMEADNPISFPFECKQYLMQLLIDYVTHEPR